MSRAPAVGGACDGVLFARSGSGVRWLDPAQGRGYADPADGRYPYEFDHRQGEYVPSLECPNCGVILKMDAQGIRPSPCPLCGFDRLLEGRSDGEG